jgi:sarcosine oxidase subunit beta
VPIPGVYGGRLAGVFDVVIVGGGIQGLALAYELARRRVGRIAVLEARYPGAGASGRNGELIRSAFSSPEWMRLFDVSLRRWRHLSAELDFNLLFTPAGYLVLASTEAQLARLEADRHAHAVHGIDTELLGAAEVRELIPAIGAELVAGGLFQREGGFAHHDAAVWGYARAAQRLGVEIHADTVVTAIELARGRVTGVVADRGRIQAPIVVDAAGAAAHEVAAMAGVELPTQRYRLEMLVTESLRPFLRPAIAALQLLGYCHQTSRGEFVGGTEFATANRADDATVTLAGLRDMATKFVRLFPVLAGVRVIRHWAGLVDQTADYAPVLGQVPELEGFYLDCGWSYGFMGAPGAAELLAASIVDGKPHPVIAPFTVERLRSGKLIEEQSLVLPDPSEAPAP